MDDISAPTTRRALLGASAIGLAAAAAGSSAAAPPGASSDPTPVSYPALEVIADRAALAAYRAAGLGTRVVLAEPLRRGEFVACARNAWEDRIAVDPYQAFCIASTADHQVVWVRDFTGPASLDWGGAKGDGVADDAPYINAMLGNPHVNWFRIEDGRQHFLTEPIRIRRAVTLIGAGVRNSVFTVKAPIDAIEVSLSSALESGLHLADFGIVNAMPIGAPTAGSGIRLKLAWLAKLSNIRIFNCWNGVHSSRSNLTNIDAIHLLDCVNAGLLFDGGHNFDTRVIGFTISGGTYAIRLQDMCDEMIFTDGVCSRARYALYADASHYAVNQRPEFCRFSRVSFDSCVNGLDLGNCTDFVFDACFVSCRPNHGAEVGVRGPVENIQFVTTTFFNNAKSAAVVGAHAIDTDFVACKFVSNGTAKPDTYDTLVFAGGCGSFSLAQNRFRHGWDVASTPRYQVRIEEQGSASYSLMGNHFAAGGSGTVLDERGGAGRSMLGNIGL